MLREEEPKYTTLSHCWGPNTSKPRMMTTKLTEAMYMQSIPTDELPRTFRDAIRITRLLQVRYLWIDSLCIVQDDTADWQVEAGNMSSVFQGSYLTIAATSSSDSYGGCIFNFRRKGEYKRVHTVGAMPEFTRDTPPSSASVMFLQNEKRLYDYLKKSPLSERAWVLQEAVLSPRILHCANDQFYWQCRAELTSEDGQVNKDSAKVLRGGELISVPQEFSDKISAGRTWWRYIEDYSKRNLTYATDRVAAISGLTRYFQEKTGDIPLLGLWKSSLPFDLSWCMEPYGRSTRLSNSLPSWSWLSIQGALNPMYKTYKDEPEIHIKAHILDCDVQWTGQPYSSEPKSSQLSLSGLVISDKALVDFIRPDFYKNTFIGSHRGEFFPDYTPSAEEPGTVVLLLLYTVPPVIEEHYLALIPISQSPLTYRRVGAGFIRSNEENLSWFYGAQEKTLHLV
jgi:hypothetical protein